MDAHILLLGIDGGGTSCRARLCALSGEVLGEAATGPANLRLGLEQSFSAVADAATQTLDQAGISSVHLTRVVACLALAGASEPTYLAAAQSYPHPFRKAIVITDAHAACLGAHGQRDGGVIVAAPARLAGRRYEGKLTGSAAGDYRFRTKAAAPGSVAKRYAGCCGRSMAASHGPACCAISAEEFGNDPHFVVRWADTASPRDFGSFTPRIFDYAVRGDPVGVELAELAAAPYRCTRGAACRYWRGAAGAGRRLFSLPAKLSRRDDQSHLVEPSGDALEGALQVARSAAQSLARVA